MELSRPRTELDNEKLMKPPETDEELMAAARRGDEAAFLALYRRRQGAIYRYALHMSGSATAAEDITQEAFLALLKGNFGFDPERGTLASYLFGVARKLALRQMDRVYSDVSLDEKGEQGIESARSAEVADPLEALTEKERIEALQKAVVSLPRRYREVVVLCDLEEIDYAEAAAILGCPIGTVRSRLHRARGLLLEKLDRDHRPRGSIQTLKPLRCSI